MAHRPSPCILPSTQSPVRQRQRVEHREYTTRGIEKGAVPLQKAEGGAVAGRAGRRRWTAPVYFSTAPLSSGAYVTVPLPCRLSSRHSPSSGERSGRHERAPSPTVPL